MTGGGEALGYDTFMLLNIKYHFQFPANIDHDKICAYSVWQMNELDYCQFQIKVQNFRVYKIMENTAEGSSGLDIRSPQGQGFLC